MRTTRWPLAVVLVIAASMLLVGCRSGTVDHVVDGDTVDIAGARFRIIGIDTPERGRCGFKAASSRMSELVLGRKVWIVSDKANGAGATDRYGRELAYIEVDGPSGRIDVGRQLIAEGFAIARYDRLDGYPRHDRQDDYRRLDALQTERCPRW